MKRGWLVLVSLIGWLVLAPTVALAVLPGDPGPGGNCPDGQIPRTDNSCAKDPFLTNTSTTCPNGVEIALPILSGGSKCIANSTPGGPIVAYLVLILQLLSKAFGVVLILLLIIAGVQYQASLGDPARVKAAKTRLQNAIIALLAFLLMAAILNFLVPGGLL